MTITIDEEFQNLLPPLGADELATLTELLVAEGCRDRLVTWDGLLVDGHHRYTICQEHGIPFDAVAQTFTCREEVKAWMSRTQRGRRALVKADEVRLVIECEEPWAKKQAKARQVRKSADSVAQSSEQQTREPWVAKQMAAKAGVSHDTYTKVAKVLETGDEDTKAAMLAGDISINRAYNHRAQGTGENEWYTPKEWVECVRRALRGIGLDPASSEKAQEVVRANRFFTEADDALKQDWGDGTVFLNPPYSSPLCGQFVEKLINNLLDPACECGGEDDLPHGWDEDSGVEAAILLTHNYTETKWFQWALLHSDCVFFPSRRIRFVSDTGVLASPTQGQAFFYFGHEPELFYEVFSEQDGLIVTTATTNPWATAEAA